METANLRESTLMKNLLALLFVALLLNGCDRGDAKVRQQLLGTWQKPDGGQITLQADGSFHSHWTLSLTNTPKEWLYDGTWSIKDNSVRLAITNAGARNTTNFEAIGTIEHWKIIQLDEKRLTIANTNQTNSFERGK